MVAEKNNIITSRRKNALRPISLFFTITTGVLLILLICSFSSTSTSSSSSSTFLSDDGTSTTTSSSNSKDNNNNNNDIIRQRRRLTATKTTTKTTTTTTRDDYEIKAKEDHYPLFSVSDSITPIGPSIFPKPTYVFHNYDHYNNNDEDKDEGEDEDHGENENENIDNETEIVTYIKPISGVHRPNQDAVFVFAAEYSFETYILFLMTLFETGYTGDVVVGISIMDWEQKDIREILEYWNNDLNSNSNNGDNDDEKSIGMNIIVYVVPYHCYNLEGEELKSHKGGMRVCQCHNLFGRRSSTSSSSSSSSNKELLTPLLDKRHGRTAQTIRYEIYWIWSEYYSPHNWILLIDARDTIFQETPFGRVPRQKRTTTTDNDDDDNDDGGGSLIFFGENVDATSLGKSKYNRKWLQLAYGDVVADAFSKKPTICSGSTMGEQIAIEMYLRAMVGESDESKTVIFGADQGFHNYLYYSNKLVNTKAIKQILVQDQGFGIINNMGALRDKELSLWGNGKIVQQESSSSSSKNIILNWDGTISPIVHQYDRHKELSQWWHKVRFNQFKDQWKKMKQDKKR